MASEHVDCIIIGAGISGIDAAYHLKSRCPSHSYLILERRGNIGGTWDLFRYPGIRSDSDMFTFGFSFKPWPSAKGIAPGEDIMKYLQDTVEEFDILPHIRFNTHVVEAVWTTSAACWTLQTQDGKTYTCSFLVSCGGYYMYDEPYQPKFAGQDRFQGRIVHPQLWGREDDQSYQGKHVAIIGSGATAITLLPNLAKGAKHVTMVQRTPTYMVAAPPQDPVANTLSKILPASTTHSMVKWKNVLLGKAAFSWMRAYPGAAKKFLIDGVWKEVQGCMSRKEFEKHFTPPYNPWDQRLCVTPVGDFFDAIRNGQASIVTDHIESFTEKGILLKSGHHVDAEVIITATGLTLQRNFPMSTMRVIVDGEEYDPKQKMIYKGMMVSGVPNFAFTVGYTNASWTLKADLTSAYICRLLNHMRAKKYSVCCPHSDMSEEADGNLLGGLTSGYVSRADGHMPRPGKHAPWKINNDYIRDRIELGWTSLENSSMRFTPAMPRSRL